jgi:hypothetical protein
VFDRQRPVLLVNRSDGDWVLVCGDTHPDDASSYCVVGIGHVIDHDPTLEETLDLSPEWEAERSAVGAPWRRQIASDE